MPYSKKLHTPEEIRLLRREVGRRYAAKTLESRRAKRVEASRRHYNKHSAKYAEYRKSLKCRTRVKNWHLENKEYYKRYIECHRLFRDYGITVEERDALFAENGGLCQICSKETALHIDHCHASGMIRGALCQKCNTGIGMLGDTKEMIQKALDYFERSEVRHGQLN
jgi:hypothetical protein